MGELRWVNWVLMGYCMWDSINPALIDNREYHNVLIKQFNQADS